MSVTDAESSALAAASSLFPLWEFPTVARKMPATHSSCERPSLVEAVGRQSPALVPDLHCPPAAVSANPSACVWFGMGEPVGREEHQLGRSDVDAPRSWTP